MNLNINIEFIDIQHFIRVCVWISSIYEKNTHTKIPLEESFLKINC